MSTGEVSIERSLNAEALRELSGQWSAIRAATSTDAAQLRALERGFEAHRSKLFVENATLQAERADDEASTRIECNQLAIKASTVALAELREALSPR
jgi:hypothetical protein